MTWFLVRSAGWASLALVLTLALVTTVAVARFAPAVPVLGPADWAALRFTVGQAVLSAGLSVALAIPLARALARRRFPGRAVLVALMGAPFILPAIVAVFGLLAVWGRAGIVSQGLDILGLPPVSIYGPVGVVLAHVFFNLPLATRIILQGWLSIPQEQFRLAATLSMTRRDVARHLERPMLRAVVPGAALVIFLLCLSSFAVALALGGGPRATTIELAIYQAVRFEFDLPKAAALAVIQVMLCLGAATLTLSVARPVDTAPGLDRVVERWDAQGGRASDATLITVAAVFLTLPLAMVVWRGVFGLFDMPPTIWRALATSLLIALPAAGLAVAMAGALAALILRMGARVPGVARGVEAAAILALAVSPFVMGTGLFLILNPWTDPFAAAIPVTVAVNAVLAMPFGLRVLLPALRDAEATQGRLGRSLGLSGWRLFRVAIWPRIRRAVGFSMGLAAALSMGDLGVITLFAPPGVETLPLAMYRLMGSYRTAGADGAALVLVAAAFALLWLFDRGGRVDDPL